MTVSSWLADYHLAGPAIGLATFLIIGLFHPLVIKAEYYWGQKSRYAFLALACGALAAAIFVEEIFWSAILSVIGFSCLWSVREIADQKRRIERGWFPPNPRHLDRYDFKPGVKITQDNEHSENKKTYYLKTQLQHKQ